MFSRFVRFYSMSDRETLAMPAMRFWLLHRNIDRITAEENLKLLDVGIGSQSGEGYKAIAKNLRELLGDVVIYGKSPANRSGDASEPEQPDRIGLAVLKGMQHQKIGQRV